jgi:hypothetical protein
MAWQTTFNGNWKTALTTALTTATVKLGPVSNVEADPNTSATIICSTQRQWSPSESPTGTRTYNVDLYLGVVMQGMDDGDAVDDLWDTLDTIEDAAWTILQPGTFRNTNKIDAVVSIAAQPLTARTGTVRVTLRVRR